jgi:aspartyl-tRNA(Asn)/glutamyl-tRNA(Gln) amidotransferase subunit B
MVTEPDLRSPRQAEIFLQEVQRLMRALRISNADMEKGQLRCDANISGREGGRSTAVVEIKNMNSFRSVERALTFEAERLSSMLSENKEREVVKETRGWDDDLGVTAPQRSKEAAHDYRYFPEPDLPPLRFSKAWIDEVRHDLPEMPRQRERRLQEQLGIKTSDAKILVADTRLADFFEETVSELGGWMEAEQEIKPSDLEKNKRRLAQLASNWILSELMKYLKRDGVTVDKIKIAPENMAEFIDIVQRQEVNSSAAQRVLREMYETGKDPSQIVDDRDLRQVSDREAVEAAVAKTLADHPGPAADWKAGKEQALHFLIGQVMKVTGGKVNPQLTRQMLIKKLKRHS